MATLIAFYLFFVAACLLLYVLNQVLSGKEELVSLHNFFIAGLIIFQVSGAGLSIISGDTGHFHPAEIDSTSVKYAMILSVFIVIYLCTHKMSTAFIDRRFERRSGMKTSYSPIGIMVIAGSIIGFGIVSQYVLVYIPVLGPGFFKIAYGMYAIGAGLAAWVAAPRLWNPFFLLLASFMILTAMVLTFAQNFGRRDLLGVVLAVLWALYFSHWRSLGFRKVFMRMFVVSFAGLILLALVTSARSGDFRDQTAMENISTLKSASASEGLADVFYGQRAGLNSMWLIETRPDSHPYDTLHSIRLFVTLPIPRATWPGKPDALGITMPTKEIKVRGKPPEWNIGPGIVGHIANDNPYLAIWMYPIILGFTIRFFDRAVVWFSTNPFVVLPMGAAIGQFVAIPRGELGSFYFLAILNIVSSFVIMKSISWVLTQIGWVKAEPGGWDENWEGDNAGWDGDEEWGYEATYGDEYGEENMAQAQAHMES